MGDTEESCAGEEDDVGEDMIEFCPKEGVAIVGEDKRVGEISLEIGVATGWEEVVDGCTEFVMGDGHEVDGDVNSARGGNQLMILGGKIG